MIIITIQQGSKEAELSPGMIIANGYKLLLSHALLPSLFPDKSEATNADYVTFSALTPQWLSYMDTSRPAQH